MGSRETIFKNAGNTLLCRITKEYLQKKEQLTYILKSEKLKPNPNQNQLHNHLQDIQNYKDRGSIIQSKEKLITGKTK